MILLRRSGACVLLTVWVAVAVVAAQVPSSPGPALSCPAMESFLKTAKVVDRRSIPVGVTAPSRVTLEQGSLRHDAAVQTIDVKKPMYSTPRGTELNFRDTWEFNVAGYELAKILELNMVPPYVERRLSGVLGSFSWWVNDAMMDRDRFRKKITPPDPVSWNHQMYAIHAFNQLIGDADLNRTNILITKDWRLWMIDFSRAFRPTKTLRDAGELAMIDRKLLESLRDLRPDVLQQRLGQWVNKSEIEAVLARRDLIVGHFDAAIAARGEAAVLYDFTRTREPCGAGLS
jgi:hypothetical protein